MKKSVYSSLKEWSIAESLAYSAASKKGLLEKICEIYGWYYTKKWTEKSILETILPTHLSFTQWSKECPNAKAAAYKHGLLDKICKLKNWKKLSIYTNEDLQKIALEFPTKISFLKKNPSAYKTAFGKGILNNICKHMDLKGSLTIKRIFLDAKKCKTRKEFQNKFGGSANKARKLGIMDEVCKHMKLVYVPLTKLEVLKRSKKCKTRSEFSIKGRGAYRYAVRNGFLDEACSHMKIK